MEFLIRAALALALSTPLAETPATSAGAGQTSLPARTGDETSAGVPTSRNAGNARVRPTRVIFIIARDCARCDEELARLRRAGGDFEKLRDSGWTIGTGPESHLQVIDKDRLDEAQAAGWMPQLTLAELPTIACVSDGKIVRSYKTGCRTPLDVWTFGFLAKGVDERPKEFVLEAARAESTGHYPLRGNHWSIDEDWNPTREKVLSHLRGPNHAHQTARYPSVERWSYEELRSLHDNLHEQEMISTGRSQPTNQFSATRKASGH